MKIGVSSYSYHSANLGTFEIIKKAKEMGFSAIEFSGFPGIPDGETPLSFAPKVKEECERAGLKIVNYAVGADFLYGSGGNLEAEIERLKDEVRVANILGSGVMRHDAAYGFTKDYKGPKGFDDALPRLVKGCRSVTEFAAGLGVRTMIENHGFFCQDSERVEKLVNGVNNPNFGLLIDMGNFLCVDEDPAKALGRLMPYAFHVHAKDFHVKKGTMANPGAGWFMSRGGNYLRGAIIGHGDVPIIQCLKIMKNVGYDGILSIEFEGMEDPIKGISVGFENLNRFVKEIFD